MNTLSSMLKFLGETLGANPNTLTTTNKTLVAAINEVRSMVYPVGSYLWTSDAGFDPNVTFGGTWEKMDEGIVLVSAGTNYTISSGTAKDGGEATHKLLENEMPSHLHSAVNGQAGFLAYKWNESVGRSRLGSSSTGKYVFAATDSGDLMYAAQCGAAGGTSAHNNMQPYKNAFCWHRTA